MLRALVDQGWFEKSRKGYYSLSPRALMELRGWLIETYNDVEESEDEDGAARAPRIKFCQACKEIVTVVRSLVLSFFPLLFRGEDIFRWMPFADYTVSASGPTLSQDELPMQAPRHLHGQLLPNTKAKKVPPLQERLDRREPRGRESSRGLVFHVQEAEEQRRRLGCPALEPYCRGKGEERGRERDRG